jgi:hypothetical protein
MPEQTSMDKVIEKAEEIFQTIRRLGNGRYDADDASYCVDLIIDAIREARIEAAEMALDSLPVAPECSCEHQGSFASCGCNAYGAGISSSKIALNALINQLKQQ